MTTYFSYLPLNWNFTKTFVIYKRSVGFSLFFGLSLPGDPGHDKSKFFLLQRQPQTSHISQLEAEIRLLCFIVCFCAKFVWAVVTKFVKWTRMILSQIKLKLLKHLQYFVIEIGITVEATRKKLESMVW